MRRAELLDAGPEGTVLFKFRITPQYSNLNGKDVLDKMLLLIAQA